MKLRSIATLFLLCSALNVSAQPSDHGQFWVPTDVKWERIPGAPREEHRKTASTIVLYFGKNGEFVRDECWLIRDGKSISISNGDPHSQYVGRITEPMADGAKYTYRLVRRTVEKEGEVLPGPEISEFASSKAMSGLEIQGHFFRRVKLANESDYIELYKTLARQYAQQ
ncbi:exported hypothetical protein [Candidatus Sulfotelmatobacter sp. SbA7]|nr:exported hypothetical protein [Candidatus Sulfotelmatobacter sp. SbA7]